LNGHILQIIKEKNEPNETEETSLGNYTRRLLSSLLQIIDHHFMACETYPALLYPHYLSAL